MSDRVAFQGEHGSYERAPTPLVVPGSARIFETHTPPGHLYKEFPEPFAGRHVARLRSLVEIGRLVGDGQVKRSGARRIVWPIDLVVPDDRVEGVLLPRAPAEFFRPTNGLMELAQSFSYLVGDDHPAAALRMTIVSQLAEALDMLDRTDLVHGDVSASNMLWCRQPKPSLLLIDADGIHATGFEVDPAHTPHWDDPRRDGEIVRHDKRSDWYALALAVYRACVLDYRADPLHDGGKTLRTLPDELAQPLAQVFDDPLDADARVRPAKWRTALLEAAQDADVCAAIDAAFGGSRGSVRERRGRGPAKAAGAKLARPRPARPVTPRPRVRAAGSSARRAAGRGTSVDRGRRAGLAIALVASGAIVFAIVLALRADHHAEERRTAATDSRLARALPSSFEACRSDRAKTPANVTAAVRCQADGERVEVLQFSTQQELSDYTDEQTTAALIVMGDQPTPSVCGDNGGTWTFTAHKDRRVGRMLFSSDGSSPRVDWTISAKRRYFVAIGHDESLAEMCQWWIDLPL